MAKIYRLFSNVRVCVSERVALLVCVNSDVVHTIFTFSKHKISKQNRIELPGAFKYA